MKIGRRLYNGDVDIQNMLALVHDSVSDNLHVMDMPYRLSSWALDDPQNIGLWVDENDQLVAWAVLQTPMWVVDYVHLPTISLETIHSLILPWVDSQARLSLETPRGHPMWFINVSADQHHRIQALEADGFRCQVNVANNPWRKAFLIHSAHMPVSRDALPEGITIRPFAGEHEIDAYVKLHRRAFGSMNMTPAWRRRILQRAEYRPDLDLVAVTAEGRLVAFCIGWYDSAGISQMPCGQIEPLGVDEDFRQRGLGRAILSEGLRRLRDYGAEQIYVEANETDDRAFVFYQSVGFRVAKNILVYRKDYAGSP